MSDENRDQDAMVPFGDSPTEWVRDFAARHRIAVRLIFFGVLFWTVWRVGFYFRTPILDEGICNPDVAGAAYSAQFLTEPGSIYANTVETKPPLTYVMYRLMFERYGARFFPLNLMTLFYHFACAVVLFFVGRRLANTTAGVFCAILYAAYSAISSADGLCANFETWTLLPLLGALWCLVRAHSENDAAGWPIFLAGALVAVATLFKQQAAVFVVAYAVGIVLETRAAPRAWNLTPWPKALALYVAGGLLATVPVLAFFYAHDGVGAMVRNLNPLNYVGYAQSEGWGFLNVQIMGTMFPFFLNTRWFFFLLLVALVPVPPDRERQETVRPAAARLMGAYLVATLFAVFAGTKFFDHYLILLVPAMIIVVGRFLGQVMHRSDANAWYKAALMFTLLVGVSKDLQIEDWVAEETEFNFTWRGHSDLNEESWSYWGPVTIARNFALSKRAQRLGECLFEHAGPGETLYVWDYIPQVYFYARMRAPTRHFMYFDVTADLPKGSGRWHDRVDAHVQAAREELLHNLSENKPKFIVRFSGVEHELPEVHIIEPAPMFDDLKKFVDENYQTFDGCPDEYFRVDERAGQG